MKQVTLKAILTMVFLFTASQSMAASSHSTHSMEGSHSMDSSHTMDASHGAGMMKIHESEKDGYTLEYHLIDMKEKMAGMKNMPEMKETHHMMVFVKDKDGHAVEKARVGYLIENVETGSIEKKMAMGMNQGFGADVTLEKDNHYIIKAKIMADDTTLMDEFDYNDHGH